MEAKNIKSVADAERFVEGCLNDFELGVSSKSEIMKHFADYTIRIFEMAKPTYEVRGGCYQPTVDNTTTPPTGLNSIFDKGYQPTDKLDTSIPPSKHKLKLRSNSIELLDAYSKFLEKNGYLDADWNMEEPYAIDAFLEKNPYLFTEKRLTDVINFPIGSKLDEKKFDCSDCTLFPCKYQEEHGELIRMALDTCKDKIKETRSCDAGVPGTCPNAEYHPLKCDGCNRFF